MLGYLVFALAAGAMLPFQFGINAQLSHWVGGPIRAAFVSFVVGTIGLLSCIKERKNLEFEYQYLQEELRLRFRCQ